MDRFNIKLQKQKVYKNIFFLSIGTYIFQTLHAVHQFMIYLKYFILYKFICTYYIKKVFGS